MKSLLIFAFAFLLVTQTSSQCTISNPGQITLDQGTAVICMHLYSDYNGTNTYKSSFAFKLDVDYFEAIVLNGFADFIKSQIANQSSLAITAVLQFQNSNDTQNITMEIYNKTGQRFRDILSFIIIVNEGNFNQLRSDNQKCDNLIGDSICYNGEAYSKTSDGKYYGNEPRFFVSWMGSDVNKNHFISHTRRLSRFSAFSVGSIYNDAKNVITA